MSTAQRTKKSLSLEEFLKLPDIDDNPNWEYIDGRIEVKEMPQKKHAMIQGKLLNRINAHAEPLGLGLAFIELRCTFAGRSIVPDVVFLFDDHIEVDEQGEFVNETWIPPDIHVEIISPDQSVAKSHMKLLHSTANGCDLGVLIHPEKKTIEIYRPGRTIGRLAPEGAIDFEPVLPGLRVTVAEVFGWLVYQKRGTDRA